MLLYALTIFLSAFLLFQAEPIVARLILPWFGGSAAVWTTCLLFFQVGLLLGYAYAHGSVRYLRPRAQGAVHTGLLAASLLVVPFAPRGSWKPLTPQEPTLQILLLLAIIIGLPYFLLSATSPLLQAWYSRHPGDAVPAPWQEKRPAVRAPYRLYALSNAGSMLALLTYPVLVEPLLTTRQQFLSWSVGYVAFVLVCVIVALQSRARAPAEAYSRAEMRPLGAPGLKSGSVPDETHLRGFGEELTREGGFGPVQTGVSTPGPVGWGLYALWIVLSACASALLLAVTNYLTRNVAAIPFLWLLPLALYLLSFIVCFGAREWEWSKPFLPLPALALAAMAVASVDLTEDMSSRVFIPLFAAGLFVCCIACHGELARLKPDPSHLTAFYMMISLGGALGGAFVALLAPRIFTGYHELPVTLAVTAVLALFLLYRDARQPWWQPAWLVLLALTLALGGYLLHGVREATADSRLLVRNFYGALRVSDSEGIRTLTNGTIIHGEQFLDPARSMEPITYYGPESGVGLAIRSLPRDRPRRIGIIGLGTGTLASYGRPGDVYRFYEINPLVLRVARTQFTFLKNCKARVEVALGDARLSLEREPPQQFDVLAVDAFSSDAIPVHLLTREAFALYFRHLKPHGVLAAHISNRFIDLEPVVAGEAGALGKEAMLVDSDEDEDNGIFEADWALVTGWHDCFSNPGIAGAAKPLRPERKIRLWTDDYSSIYPLLR